MNLHNEIMNIQVNNNTINSEVGSPKDYKLGHRDARHAAAELSLKYERLIEKLFDALCDRHADDLVDELKEEFGYDC